MVNKLAGSGRGWVESVAASLTAEPEGAKGAMRICYFSLRIFAPLRLSGKRKAIQSMTSTVIL